MKNIFHENKWDKIQKKKQEEARLKKLREAQKAKEKKDKAK
ncbi:MAG: hypothetical protein R3232_03645 [Clostridia bacterium]|nr:hypothetical protein [Clostridia bacterium]